MDNPLFLVTKGLKAKKKRLAAGGGGGGGITFGTKAIGFTNKAPPYVHSSVTMEITNITTGAFYQDATTGTNITNIPVSDYVAHSNGAQNLFPDLSNGIAILPTGQDWSINILAFWNLAVNTANPTGTEQLTVSVIQDTGNNVASGHIVLPSIGSPPPANFSLTSPYRNPFGQRIEIAIAPPAATGTIILKLQIVGGTTDTDANVINGSATISDSYYLRLNLV